MPLSADEYHRSIGTVASLMTKSSEYCQYPIASLTVWIEPAILLDQIHFFRDRGNNAIGYITWALLAADTEHRLLHDPQVIFHLSEWNEGDRLWIMDMVLIDGRMNSILDEIKDLFPSFEKAKFLRRWEDGSIRKVSTWLR